MKAQQRRQLRCHGSSHKCCSQLPEDLSAPKSTACHQRLNVQKKHMPDPCRLRLQAPYSRVQSWRTLVLIYGTTLYPRRPYPATESGVAQCHRVRRCQGADWLPVDLHTCCRQSTQRGSCQGTQAGVAEGVAVRVDACGCCTCEVPVNLAEVFDGASA